jgi:hypothetical protein
MAQYRFSPDIVSRGKGQSIIAKAAYNAREDIRDERTGEMKRHGQRPGLEWSGIFAPKDAPEWTKDRAQLWNAVERREDLSKRHDTAQLARSFEVNFPHELSAEDRRRLVRDFVREECVRKGMIADVAIHAPSEEGDQRNHHAHILLTLRAITPEGFGDKVREWNSKEQNLQWREKWADLGARYLKNAGYEIEAERYKVEYLTLERQRQIALERGDLAHAETLNRVPTKHLGPQGTAMERRGVETQIGNAYRDDYRAAQEEAADRAEIEKLDRRIAELTAAPRPAGAPEHLRGTAAEIWLAVHQSDSPKAIAAALDHRGVALAVATKAEAERSRTDAAAARDNGQYAPVYREGEILAVDHRAFVYRFTEEKTGSDFRDMQRYLRTLDTSKLHGIDDTRESQQEKQRQRVNERHSPTVAPTPEATHTSPALHFADAARDAARPEAAPTMPAKLRGTAADIWTAYNIHVWQREEVRTAERLLDGGNIQLNVSFSETVHVPVELKGNRDPRQFAAALEPNGIELAKVTKEEAEHSRKEAEHSRAHGEKRPAYREGEIVAVNRRGDVHQLTEKNTGENREAVQRFLNKAEWKALPGIEATKQTMRTRAAERRTERQATGDKWAGIRLKNATTIKSNHRHMGKENQQPAAVLKRGGRKALSIAASVIGKVADIAGDLLAGAPVQKTRQQMEIQIVDNERTAHAAERQAAAVHRWQDYTDEYEQISAKRDHEARDAQIIAEQSKRLQRDRDGGRERDR